MGEISRNAIAKWKPVVENMFSINNKQLIDHICNFSEWRNNCDDSEIVEKLRDIKEAIQGHNFRTEIVGKYYNSLTNLVEYKLKDGTFINKNDTNLGTLTDNDILSIFGEEYLKFYDISLYRDIVITKLV